MRECLSVIGLALSKLVWILTTKELNVVPIFKIFKKPVAYIIGDFISLVAAKPNS